jgi:hypothetical protein
MSDEVEATALVVEPRAEAFSPEDPAAPSVGKWYWLTTLEREVDGWGKTEDGDDVPNYKEVLGKEFACVVRIGSNYVELQGLDRGDRRYPSRPTWRVHFDNFAENCSWIPDPQRIIDGSKKLHQDAVVLLLQEIREVTASLAITPGLGLPGFQPPPETQSVGLVLAKDKPAAEYKTALIKAQKETLPELFERIEHEHAEMARWMGAPLIPIYANSNAMKPAIAAIENRLFSVELYAGLCEEVVQIKKGEPAKLQEKLRIFQRRAYMDEECLAHYEAGGMDFKNLAAFDRWFCKPAQIERLMPFPRCVLAFQVRRKKKEREFDGSLAAYFRIAEEEKLDKLTFLYIRNGARMYRLNTTIDFDEHLFPDMRHVEPNGALYAHNTGGARWLLKGEHELRAMREEHMKAVAERKIRMKKVPKEDRHWITNEKPKTTVDDYEPFDHTNVYYDDISKMIADDMTRHNRLVLVLQGILDRSEALHPHPPWLLWRQDSFAQAIELIYDADRVLTPGDAPDFELYRAKNLAALKVGDVTLGQESAWSSFEASKEAARERDSGRGHRHVPRHHFPPGNPGPGKFAHVAALRGEYCVFQWTKRRRGNEYGPADPDKPEVGVKLAVKRQKLFNLSAYKPGDFRQFFADPRTRADYIQWAPLLLEAEEFHAGNREVSAVKPPPPRKPRQLGGSYEYQQRKARLAWIGKAVRLIRDVTMRNKDCNKKGTLWRVQCLCRGRGFEVMRIDEHGKRVKFKLGDNSSGTDWIIGVDTLDFEEAAEIPPAPPSKSNG